MTPNENDTNTLLAGLGGEAACDASAITALAWTKHDETRRTAADKRKQATQTLLLQIEERGYEQTRKGNVSVRNLVTYAFALADARHIQRNSTAQLFEVYPSCLKDKDGMLLLQQPSNFDEPAWKTVKQRIDRRIKAWYKEQQQILGDGTCWVFPLAGHGAGGRRGVADGADGAAADDPAAGGGAGDEEPPGGAEEPPGTTAITTTTGDPPTQVPPSPAPPQDVSDAARRGDAADGDAARDGDAASNGDAALGVRARGAGVYKKIQ